MKWIFILPLFVLPGMAAHAQAVCSRSSTTVLRKGPGPKFDKSWVVAKYMPFMLVEVKGAWLKLQDMDGLLHFGRAADFSQKFRCVVIKSNTAETRQGPSTKFPYGDFKTLDRYTPLKRLSDQSGWVEVENDLGLKSWVQETKLWHPVRIQTLSF